MVLLQEYHRLGQSTGPYPYNAVAPGAPIELVKLATIYKTSPRQVRYHHCEKEIQRVAPLQSTNERYINLFPFEDSIDLTRRLGNLQYLISPSASRYKKGEYQRREVPYRRKNYVEDREELEGGSSAATLPSASCRRAILAGRFERFRTSLRCADVQLPHADSDRPPSCQSTECTLSRPSLQRCHCPHDLKPCDRGGGSICPAEYSHRRAVCATTTRSTPSQFLNGHSQDH